jgi:hypothetical protein
MGCYSPPPLQGNLTPEIEKRARATGFRGGYLDGRKSG